MQRIIVDLPEPDGPQTTIRSPLLTVRLMFLRTWNCPYHLLTPSSLIMTSSEIRIGAAACAMRGDLLSLVAGIEFALEILAVARHAEAEDEKHDGNEGQRRVYGPEPVRVARRRLRHAQQLDLPDDHNERRVHEQADE